MKNNLIFIMTGCFIFFCSCISQEQENVLRHVVLFGFSPDIEKEKIYEIEKAFGTLPNTIKEIKDYEWGIDCSPEGLQKGHTHCFFLTFSSEKDRDTYLFHPDHLEFGKLLKNKTNTITVIDYWTIR